MNPLVLVAQRHISDLFFPPTWTVNTGKPYSEPPI